MNGDTIELLKQVNSGCKMATNSLEQLHEYAKEPSLCNLIEKYDKKHIQIGDKIHILLNKDEKSERDPGSMAKAMSYLTTEMKMMIEKDAHKIADILIDGCNMGIKTLHEYMNRYQDADAKSIALARELISCEKEMSEQLYAYL